jgi:hypothetical protein
VWRHRWEETLDTHYKEKLAIYNREDCETLKLMIDELSKIQQSADTLSEVDFADKRKKPTTEVSEEIHSQFGTILKFAHFDYDEKKISFRKDLETNESTQDRREKRKYAAYMSNQKFVNIEQKAKKVIKVGQTKICPKCGYKRLRKTEKTSHRTIIDLVLTKSGIRKNIIRYEGVQGFCLKCQQFYAPPEIRKYRNRELYGDGFKAWIVYQRIALRMSYGSILESAEEYFDEKITSGRLPSFIRALGKRYTSTEKVIIQKLMSSPFIHADETKVNIQGTNHYVWVFTDGQYVIFKLTESREPTIVHELLKNYEGTLISDFYPGYDSVKCKQQKCWVHLIRNLNDDLLESLFDTELETFALEVKNLIVPIMEAVQKYGLKKRNLHKFQHEVSRFYKTTITEKLYKSDVTNTYQKLFIRYRDSLFTFLDQDGIPWHNNTAERAIRHISKQRAISTNFHASVMNDYLVLLGIRQACRFQNKSFLKFLFSGETDLDKFEARKRRR